jgi:hypothetical protein
MTTAAVVEEKNAEAARQNGNGSHQHSAEPHSPRLTVLPLRHTKVRGSGTRSMGGSGARASGGGSPAAWGRSMPRELTHPAAAVHLPPLPFLTLEK